MVARNLIEAGSLGDGGTLVLAGEWREPETAFNLYPDVQDRRLRAIGVDLRLEMAAALETDASPLPPLDHVPASPREPVSGQGLWYRVEFG